MLPVQKLRGNFTGTGIALLDLEYIQADAEVAVLCSLMRPNVRTVSVVIR
jgi:hypothetical protein